MSLATNITNLATSVATAVKQTRTWVNGNAADLSALSTTSKTNLVSAINEVNASVGSAAGIDDSTTSSSSTWSSQKTSTEITDAVSGVEAEIPTLTDLIDDTTPSSSTVYSSSKTESVVSDAVGAIDLTDLIDDASASTSTVYSSSKTDSQIAAVKDDILGGADSAFDTLRELEDALATDTSGIADLVTAVGNRVRFDASQTLTGTQQTQALTNIGGASASALSTLTTNVGDTTTDFSATFAAGLT